MRAYDIIESTPSQSPEVARTTDGVWYEVDVNKAKKYYKTVYGRTDALEVDPGERYFVFVRNSNKSKGLAEQIVKLKDGELSDGDFYSKQHGDNLRALVDATHAQRGERVWGDFILYNGQVYHKNNFIQHMPAVAQISTGAVYEIPKDALWALNRLNIRYQLSADRVLVFKNTNDDTSETWSSVSIKSGKMSDIQSQQPLDTRTQVKLNKELTQELGLQQKATVTSHIIPNSKLHKMLQAINDNPGVKRYQLYWDVLKLKQLPPYRFKSDLCWDLVVMGLVEERYDPSEKYDSLYITPIGKLVLARVSAGNSVSKSSLIKK